MVWVIVAVGGAFVLLLVVRALWGSGDEGEAATATAANHSGASALGAASLREASAPSASGDAAGASPSMGASTRSATTARAEANATRSEVSSGGAKRAKKDVKDEEEPEGTKVASVRPPAMEKAKVVDLTNASPVAEPSVSISFEDLEDDDPTGVRSLVLVTAVGRTDAGRRRKHNEDAYLVVPAHNLFVIADGMGGYAAGEVASQLAVDVIAEAYRTKTFTGDGDAALPRRGDELVRAIRMANIAILTQARANEAQQGMGTTLVSLRFSPNKLRAYVAHVGDSRCYRVRNGEMQQLTQDHTLGAVGITGPAAAKLSRAVGIGESVEVDVEIDSPRLGDVYVLCSDGLSKMVPDAMTKQIIVDEKDLEKAAQRLVDVANERGGRDNITVILVRVDSLPTAA